MNESDRRELSDLMQRQQMLEKQLVALGADIRKLEARAEQSESPVAPAAPPVAAAPSVGKSDPPLQPAPVAVPPPLPFHARVSAPQPVAPVFPLKPTPAATTSEFVPEFAKQESPKPDETKPTALLPPVSSASPAVAEPKASFEMRLGTYWLVRIGAVMILTGLVFFGNLAYQKMGAVGQVSLLYLASGLLLGAGAWWQR